MPRGGARNRSGPAADPTSARSESRGLSAGRPGRLRSIGTLVSESGGIEMKSHRWLAPLPLLLVAACAAPVGGTATPGTTLPSTTAVVEVEDAQVVVRVDGKTAAIGSIGPGTPKGYSGCTFVFSVPDVPAGEKFYEVEVTHRGGINYTEAELRHGISLSLGG